MPAPTTWSAPSSGAETSTNPNVGYTVVSYVGGYWFALTQSTGTDKTPIVRYATDPTGTWTTATMPAIPPTYDSSTILGTHHGVVYGASTYAFVMSYQTSLGTTIQRIIYASTPGGTWSQYEYDSTNEHWPSDMIHDGTQFVIVGRKRTTGTDPAFIATCTTADGTWAFNISAATTGYDPASYSGQDITIRAIEHDGTTYVTTAALSGGTFTARYSTALTSGWATPSTPPSNGSTWVLRKQSNGYWTSVGFAEATTTVWYTTTPSGTWSSFDASASTFYSVSGIAYDNGAWTISGQGDVMGLPARLAYYEATGAPNGTYTQATATLTGTSINATGLAVSAGMWVAATTYYGQLRYARVTTGPTYLRQRQSPVRSPSRVSWKAY